MQFTSFVTLAFAAIAVAAPNNCKTAWKTKTVTATSTCPIVSLPLSPLVTGTLVPVGSILNDLTARAPEPTAIEARNDCWITSEKTVTTTVKPTCGLVNLPQ